MLWTLSYITQLYKRTKHLGFKNTGWSGKAIHSDEKRQLLQFLQQPRNHCSWRARFVYSFKCCVGWKFKTGKKNISQDDIHLTFSHLQHCMIEGSVHQYTSFVVSKRWGSFEPSVCATTISQILSTQRETTLCVWRSYSINLPNDLTCSLTNFLHNVSYSLLVFMAWATKSICKN